MPELLNTHDEDEPDPLLEAALSDDVETLRRLISEGTPLDPTDGATSALGLAAGRGHLAAARVLLEAGANVNHSPAGLSPMAAACRGNHLEMAALLLARGARLDAHPDVILSWTIGTRYDRETVAFLARNGMPPNTVAHGSVSLLMAVCRHGDLETARLLLERGADLHVRLRGTALSVAEENGHRVLADFLLERGAAPVVAALAPDVEREARLRQAREAPHEAAPRLAWAQALREVGFRAAAEREFQIAQRLTGAATREVLTLENPAGTVWTFLPFDDEPTEVSPFLDDARFQRAMLTDGTRTLPLAVLLGPACGRCERTGQVVCSDCHGTGTAESYLTGRSYECAPREDCPACMGLTYEVRSEHFGRGACRHPTVALEFTSGKRTMSRCTSCQLPGFEHDEFACGVCGRFVCTCSRVAR